MGARFGRIKQWVTEILTAADLNAEFDNILNNLTPSGIDDSSGTIGAMQTTADPYPGGSESLAISLAEEIHRVRFLLKQITGEAQWYIDPAVTLKILGSKSADIVSAATVDLSEATGSFIHITGSDGPITSFGTVDEGIEFVLVFDSTPTITHNATSLILPGGESITAESGDVMIVRSEGSGNWKCTSYQGATGGASISKWKPLAATTEFSTTAASTSTITMTADLTAKIKKGMPVKFKLSGTLYYALCTDITANLLTIEGAPLTTGAGDLTELSYSDLPGQIIQCNIQIPGYFADATDSTLLLHDCDHLRIKWDRPKAYLVKMASTQGVADTTAQNTLNCSIAGSNVFTSDLTLSGTAGTWASTGVAVDTSTYGIDYGNAIEIPVTKLGDGVAQDLIVQLIFVGE